MTIFAVAIILIVALLAIRASDRFGIPSLLLFLLLGVGTKMLGVNYSDFELADKFASLALMVIMFYGGFGTNWKMGKPVVKEAGVLATLGVVATALITGAFIHYVLKLPLVESMLIGSIVGSTDYASVSSILTSKNLNLKYNSASLLEMESGSNDPTAYTMTMIFLSIMLGTELSIATLVIKQITFGVGFGFLFGFLFKRFIERINIQQDGLFVIFVTAMALLVYSATNLLDGNGYLAVYLFGIFIGNLEFQDKRSVVFFFDGFTELMQIGLFFLLGLLSDPKAILNNLPMAFAIMLFMTFIARPASVWGLMLPFKLQKNQLHVITWAGLRGAAAIAFAIMAVNANAGYVSDIYHIVFGICILSSFIQGSLMPQISRKANMLDPDDTVLKTFNYYQDKTGVGFLQTKIGPNSKMIGVPVANMDMAFDFIVAQILRDGKAIVPRGHVVLEEGDTIVLAGEYYFDPQGHELTEIVLSDSHPFTNNRIVDLDLSPKELILMILTNAGDIVVPEGDTLLQAGDRIIMIEDEKEFVIPEQPQEQA